MRAYTRGRAEEEQQPQRAAAPLQHLGTEKPLQAEAPAREGRAGPATPPARGREARWRVWAAVPGGREPQSNPEGRPGDVSGPWVHVLTGAENREAWAPADSTVFLRRPLSAQGRRALGPELRHHPTQGRFGHENQLITGT